MQIQTGEEKIIRKVAIIGGGPKGIYGFERLTAWLKAKPPFERTEIHIYNKTGSFGSGENYRPEQPPWLLMNNPAGEINMWSGDNPPPVVPHPYSLADWVYHDGGSRTSNNYYTARADAGRYLLYGFKQIASNLPQNVYGKYIISEVVDIDSDSGKYSITLKTQGNDKNHSPADRYDHVLLATGHPNHNETQEVLECRSFADAHAKAGYIPFIYPAETMFSDVPANCSLAIKGMGLTFTDAVLALTEGKGGRFEKKTKSEKLTYIPSGYEPAVIYPFSRTGLPMIPRISVPNGNKKLMYFTQSALQKFQPDTKIDFKLQIWPLLKQDMIYAYYDIALKNAGYPQGLSVCDNYEDVERIVEKYHEKFSFNERFDAERFLNPVQNTKAGKGITHDQYIKSLFCTYLQEAWKGELWSPLAAVTAVWRKATPLFCELYSFGGLTPESQRYFDSSMRGMLNRVTFGPPVKSAEKLFALMECGILNFNAANNPDLVLDDKSGSFILQNNPEGTRYPFQYLVDARMPKVALADAPGTLFGNLLKRGLISIFENRMGLEIYQPGAVNITARGFVIDQKGRTNTGIAVTGTPTEGITFDNDTLSPKRNNFVDGWAEFISMEYSKSKHKEYAD